MIKIIVRVYTNELNKVQILGGIFMKKTKALFILLLILFMSLMPFTKVSAHTVDLDPDSLISFPWWISNGEGTITIDEEETGYTLYYQAVEIPNDDYTEMETIRTNGETALDTLDQELEELDVECDNLKTAYDEAFEAWEAKVDSSASEAEIAEAKTAYETARTTWQNKVGEYNTKVEEYNTKSDEIESNIKILVPTYVESNWVKTEDGSFAVDLTQFSGDRAFAVWAKLVYSDGTIAYDEATYTMSGTKPKEIAVEKIILNKSEVTITEGSNYTLTPTITPEDATNKLVIWTSEDENIAKVEDGKITAVAEGTTTITATTKDGGYTATCKVTITKKVTTPTPEPENKEPDSTLLEGELPKAGSLTYIIIIAILGLSIIGIVMYKKVKYLNFK